MYASVKHFQAYMEVQTINWSLKWFKHFFSSNSLKNILPFISYIDTVIRFNSMLLNYELK